MKTRARVLLHAVQQGKLGTSTPAADGDGMRSLLAPFFLLMICAQISPVNADTSQPVACKLTPLISAGSVSGEGDTAGPIISVRWANGTLKLHNGAIHRFQARGIKSAVFGEGKFKMGGDVFNLQNASEFAGTYRLADSAIVPKIKENERVYVNENCVVLVASTDEPRAWMADRPVEAFSLKLVD